MPASRRAVRTDQIARATGCAVAPPGAQPADRAAHAADKLMRSVLAELGTATPVGIEKALQMARRIVDGEVELDLPAEATKVASLLADHLLQLHAKLRKMNPPISAWPII